MLDREMTTNHNDGLPESAQSGKRARSSLHSRSRSPVSNQPVSEAHRDKRPRLESQAPPQPTDSKKESPLSPPNSALPEEDDGPSRLVSQEPQEQADWETTAKMHGFLKPPFYAVTFACSRETEDVPIGLMEICTTYDLARKFALQLMHSEFRRIHGKTWEQFLEDTTGDEFLVCTSKEEKTGERWLAEWTYGDFYHQFVDVTPWTPISQMTSG